MTVSGIAGLVLDRHFILVHAEFVINISSTRTQPAIEIDNEPNYSGDKFFFFEYCTIYNPSFSPGL